MTSLGYYGGDDESETLRDGAIEVRFAKFSEVRATVSNGFVGQRILIRYSGPSLNRRPL